MYLPQSAFVIDSVAVSKSFAYDFCWKSFLLFCFSIAIYLFSLLIV